MTNDFQLALFGSAARGSADERSDLDVIVVVRDPASIDLNSVRSRVASIFPVGLGLSIYSEKRLQSMWREGSPFAWHLYLEARAVDGFDSSFLRFWGAPSPYVAALEDCRSMVSLIKSTYDRISKNGARRECYEAGLLYVGARNAGMFASFELLDSFIFSRDVPYNFCSPIEFPLKRWDYDQLVAARHATTRGASVPYVEMSWLIRSASAVVYWSESVLDALQSKSRTL